MKTTKYALAAATLVLIELMAPSLVRADIVEFEATGTFCVSDPTGTFCQKTSFLAGTVTVDTTAGYVVDATVNITGAYAEGPYTYDYAIDGPSGQGVAPPNPYFIVVADKSTGDLGDILIPVTSLVGYSGGPLCGTVNAISACSGTTMVFDDASIFGQIQYLDNGKLTPAVAAAEPETVVLLATGLLCLVGVGAARRKRLA